MSIINLLLIKLGLLMSIQSLYSLQGDPSNYVGVPQHGYAITSAKSSRAILFTSNVKTCITACLYAKEKKVGALAHIDVLEDINSFANELLTIFKEQGCSKSELELHLIGGYRTDEGVGEQLVFDLKKAFNKQVSIVFDRCFEKREINLVESINLQMLVEVQETCSLEKKDEIDAQLNTIFEKTLYCQIAFNTQTGELHTSSKLEYWIDPLSKNRVYSLVSQAHSEKLEKKVNKFRNGNRSALIKYFNSPLVKVFDVTSDNEYYPS